LGDLLNKAESSAIFFKYFIILRLAEVLVIYNLLDF
jgi:F0F1-type ATP synthase membrane subunit c/vacuolar-type H+-ATPase subunit K